MKQISYAELEAYLYPKIRHSLQIDKMSSDATHVVVFQGGGPVPATTTTALIPVGPGLRFSSLEAAYSSHYSDHTAHPLHPVAHYEIPREGLTS